MSMINKLKKNKEIAKYLVVGCSAVLIDFIAYFVLAKFVNPDLSKAGSYILGSISSFILNKFWTFDSKYKTYTEALKFISLYIITFLLNTFINKGLLNIGAHKIIAFGIATGTTVVLNYIGQKFWVFKANKEKK